MQISYNDNWLFGYTALNCISIIGISIIIRSDENLSY